MRYALASFLALIACSGPTKIAAGDIKIAQANSMKACVSVGIIEERVESPTDVETLREQIRSQVKERAEKLRATHLVLLAEESDDSYGYARAEAFRCKR